MKRGVKKFPEQNKDLIFGGLYFVQSVNITYKNMVRLHLNQYSHLNGVKKSSIAFDSPDFYFSVNSFSILSFAFDSISFILFS